VAVRSKPRRAPALRSSVRCPVTALIQLSKSNTSGPRQEGGFLQHRSQADRFPGGLQVAVAVDFGETRTNPHPSQKTQRMRHPHFCIEAVVKFWCGIIRPRCDVNAGKYGEKGCATPFLIRLVKPVQSLLRETGEECFFPEIQAAPEAPSPSPESPEH
jgi:hypothetical protein